MNARILRKWSTQTNLMSSTVCLCVVVAVLLLVICTPVTTTISLRIPMGSPPQRSEAYANLNTPVTTSTIQEQQQQKHSPIAGAAAAVIPPLMLTSNVVPLPMRLLYTNLHIPETSQQQQRQYIGAEGGIIRNIGQNERQQHLQTSPHHYHHYQHHLNTAALENRTVGDTKNIYQESRTNKLFNNNERTNTTTTTTDITVANNSHHFYTRQYKTQMLLNQTPKHLNTETSQQQPIHINHHNKNASTAFNISQLLSKVPKVPTTLRSNNYTFNIYKIPLRYIIESYEVPVSLPLNGVLTEKQRRLLIHEENVRRMQQQAARNRRDSVIGSFKRYNNNNNNNEDSHHDDQPKQFQNFRKHYPPHQQPMQTKLKQHQHTRANQRHRLRKQTRRYCSARDPAQLAFEAPTVFEGKVVSMSPHRYGNFSATLEVREVFKQQIGYHLQKYLRLQFEFHNASGECDIYREQLRARGQVRGVTMEPGRVYLFFTQQIDVGNFTILGVPIWRTRRMVEAVRNAVSENYAQYASIRSISANNRTVENGKELRVVCKVHGRPPPKVTWFKDHKSINRNRKLYKFLHYKKRSELVIRYFNTSDAGRYECRAKNKVNRNIERRAIVIKAYPVPMFDTTHLIGGAGNTCPDDALEFCFNGGTCKFFSEIGSYSCICPEGFIGERCDRKEVNNMPPSTYSNDQECGEKKFLGSYYC